MCNFPLFYVCDSKDLHLYNAQGLNHNDIVQGAPEIVSSHCIQLMPGQECITKGFVQKHFDGVVAQLVDPGKFGPFCNWYAQAF